MIRANPRMLTPWLLGRHSASCVGVGALVFGLALLGAAVCPVRAAAQYETAGRWLLSVGITPARYSHFSSESEEDEQAARSSSRLEVALGGPATLALGYGVLEVFVVEMQASLERIENSDDEEPATNDPSILFDNSRSTTTVTVGPAARLYLTRGALQPFVEAAFGFGYTHTETSVASFSLNSLYGRAGLGGQWRFADAASVSTALFFGFASASGETTLDDGSVIAVEGPADRLRRGREVEVGGDTIQFGIDLRLSVWL
jgi:hypothetical protein